MVFWFFFFPSNYLFIYRSGVKIGFAHTSLDLPFDIICNRSDLLVVRKLRAYTCSFCFKKEFEWDECDRASGPNGGFATGS